MAAHDECRRLTTLLARLVSQRRVSHRSIDKELGQSPGVTSRLFRSSTEVRLSQLLAILGIIGVQPAEFFKAAYPDQDLPSRILSHFDSGPAGLEPLSMPSAVSSEELSELIKAALREVLKEQSEDGV